MKKYKITRAEFVPKLINGKRWVCYWSVVEGNAYASVHDCTGLSDEEAKGVYDKKEGYLHGKFRREHFRQVREQYGANQRKSKIILN